MFDARAVGTLEATSGDEYVDYCRARFNNAWPVHEGVTRNDSINIGLPQWLQ